MASADFRQTLAQRISLGQCCDFPLTPPSSTGCRLMTLGLRCYSPACHRHPASLLVRVPAAKSSLPVLSACALRPRPNLRYGWRHRLRRVPFIPIVHNTCQAHGPRPRGRGMRLCPVKMRGLEPLQRGRARAGAEWTSLVTLSSASSQRLICDCLRPFRFHSFPAVDLSHTIRSISSVYVMRAPAGFSASPRRSQVRLSKNTKSHTT